MTENERTALEFLNRMAEATGHCPPTERLILQVLPGDPGTARDNAWRPRPWRPGEDLPVSPERTNGYVAISSFGRAPDKSWRRQKALFARGRMIMIDDVGTKVPREKAAVMDPTWIVETSPNNEQWIYLLDGGTTKRELMDSILDGLVAQALAPQDAKDPGMKGVTRVARIPGFINGKPKYGGDFRVKWLLKDGPVTTLAKIRTTFDLKATQFKQQERTAIRESSAVLAVRMDAFNTQMRIARGLGLLEGGVRNAGGWQRVRCPWEDEHSSSKDGADIREPSKENEFYGAFKCFHGHCDGRGWREFTDVLDKQCAEALSAANAAWKDFKA
jgi:hypothetical protein